MTDASLPADRFTAGEFRIGHVFSECWSVLLGNFFKLCLVASVTALPSLIIRQPSPANLGNPFAVTGFFWITVLVLIVLVPLSEAIVFYGAVQHMRRRPVSLVDGLKVALGRFFPLIGIGLLIMLAFAGVGLLVGLLAGALAAIPGLKYAMPLIIIVFIVLFLILFITWSVAAPACVVESLGPVRSLARSAELTKGHRWKILGLILLTLICGLLVSVIVGVMSGVTSALGGAVGFGTPVIRVTGFIGNAIWFAFFWVVVAVTYHDLRVAKEGIGTDQIAAVFE